jgi:hypothetical protein
VTQAFAKRRHDGPTATHVIFDRSFSLPMKFVSGFRRQTVTIQSYELPA